MKKTLFVVIIAVFVIGAGGVYWFYNSQLGNKQTPTAKNTNTSTTSNKPLRDFTSSGVNMKCTWTQKETSSSGTIYYKGFKNTRTDTITQIGKASGVGHVIYDGTYIYQWFESDGKIVMGTKSTSESLNNQTEKYDSLMKGQEFNQTLFIALNKQNNVNCAPWVVDESMFILPQGVEFKDIKSMMPGGSDNTTQSISK